MRSLHLIRRMLLTSALVLPFVACAPKPPLLVTSAPSSVETTATYKSLRSLPAPRRPVPVAVYSYPDLTGQFKPSDTVSTNSRAVTQGAVWMLVKALKDAAGGQWFKVIQRANLENLLRERQIIRETRGRIEKTGGRRQPALPSLLFAGLILEGGIIGYDSNTVTGGLGARYLGIGGDVQYRQDTVTVYLNAISSQTGEVLKSVMTRKTVASYGVRGSVFKFVAFQKLLEGETGYTINEPSQIAIAQAIEHAVRALIIEGALDGLWQFENKIAGKEETQAYLADKDDLLLIGDATSDAALALLTDEQLQALAKRQKKRRQEPETQSARIDVRKTPAKKNINIAENVSPAKARLTAESPKKKSEMTRRIKVPNSVQLAAQRRVAGAFSSETVKATPLTHELERLRHLKHENPPPAIVATTDNKGETPVIGSIDRVSPASDAIEAIPVTPIKATPLTFELERLPHPRPANPAPVQTAKADASGETLVIEPADSVSSASDAIQATPVTLIRVTPHALELERRPHSWPVSPTSAREAGANTGGEMPVTKPTDRVSPASDTVEVVPVTPIKATTFTFEFGRPPHLQPSSPTPVMSAKVEIRDVAQDLGATNQKAKVPETDETFLAKTVKASRPDLKLVVPAPLQPKDPTREKMTKAETVENATASGSANKVGPVSKTIPASPVSIVP